MATSSRAGPTWLDLHDWRVRVAEMSRKRDEALRSDYDAEETLERFRMAKDLLFKEHPQSPLGPEARAAFTGLAYFPYDPALRVEATLIPVAAESSETVDAPSSGAHAMPLRRAAEVTFTLGGQALGLAVYWIDVYGGGLFLPFRDATCPDESYGAGRYLFDTVKGSTFERLDGGDAMGYAGGRIALDFNYAYNPSCAYDARWVCPLAPPENWLGVPIRAGERKYDH